jgi:putative hemolysin
MTKKKIIIGLVVVAIIFVVSVLALRLISPEDNWVCNSLGQWIKHGQPSDPMPMTGCRLNTGLPNPASVHCEEVGGTLDIRPDASGGQVGYCIFPDKSECEEWALLRNQCPN